MAPAAPRTRRGEFFAGMRAMIPLVIGAVPLGIIFGALTVTNGLSPWTAIGMSLFVFAGSAQFIAVGLVAQGAALPVIILTTLVVNLRHALYSASLAPYVRHLPQRWLIPLGAMLTDESYLVTINRFERGGGSPNRHWFFLGADLGMYIPWQISTMVGIVFGAIIPNTSRLGLDFAMSATFTGMLVPMIKGRPVLLAVIVAGVTSVAAYGLPNKLGLFLAAILGVLAGVLAERRWPQPARLILETGTRAEASVDEADDL